MTDNNHPITPPPELVEQIRSDALHRSDGQLDYELRLIHSGYCAGADQELEACCDWMSNRSSLTEKLRSARRPTLPSLKEQALQALNRFMDTEGHEGCTADDIEDDYYLIRKAVESLSD